MENHVKYQVGVSFIFEQLSVYWSYSCYKPPWWWWQEWPKHVGEN